MLNNRQRIVSKSIRKAKTRTLIQLGGLVEKPGLAKAYGIGLGCDLQVEPKENLKALLLLDYLHTKVATMDNSTHKGELK